MSQLKDKTGSTIDGWFIKEYIGKQKYLCRCPDCGRYEEKLSISVNQGKIPKCKQCKEDRRRGIVNRAKQLLAEGKNVTTISKELEINLDSLISWLTKEGVIEKAEDITSGYGMTFEEIAQVLGISNQVAHKIYQRAMKKIDKLLNSDEELSRTLRQYLLDDEKLFVDSALFGSKV